jgi:cobalt/nickel transport system permease protein
MIAQAFPLDRAPARAKKTKPGFVEKTLAGIAHNIEIAVFSEENARRDGLLQRRDPRAKVGAFVVLVAAAGMSRDWRVLVALYAIVVASAAVSKLDMVSFFKRVWFGIPIFSGIVVIPSIFIVGGHALFSIPLGFYTLHASQSGLVAAGVFVLRVASPCRWRSC